MIIYRKSAKEFIDECFKDNGETISSIVSNEMRNNGIFNFSASQINAWSNSLPAIAKVFKNSDIDNDVDVAIEYKINQSKNRIDVLVYGNDDSNKSNVVVIELKQWSQCSPTRKENYIHAFGGGGENDYWHPSYQAYNYVNLLSNFNEYIQNNDIVLSACAYLHNMQNENELLIRDASIYPLVDNSPIFLKDDDKKLANFISKYVKHKNTNILYEIEKSHIVPSKHLSDMLAAALKGNEFFSYDDYQANSVSEIVATVKDALHYNEKRVIIIRGGAGTGKSVVALNALGKLISPKKGDNKCNAAYVMVNAAPRFLYADELIKNDYKKVAIKNLFKYPTVFKNCAENDYDCIIVDEAHRIFDFKAGVGLKKGTHMLKQLLKASRVSVFLIDEDQAVTKDDYASIDIIKKIAEDCRIRVVEGDDLTLTTQFRVLGGENYISFIKYFLGYDVPQVKYKKNSNYEFKVFDKANEMMKEIIEKDTRFLEVDLNTGVAKSGKCRVVAGYCYNWNTPAKNGSKGEDRTSDYYDIRLDNGEFNAKWNLRCSSLGSEYSWLSDPDSTEEVGCIYTCQGLDLNYCGVIIGKELKYRNRKIIYDKSEHANTDLASGITNLDDEKAKRLIMNTYNVLLTRGMLGTYVYCEDEELRDYLKSLIIEG